MTARRKEAGVTLIELLIAISIGAVLTGVAVSVFRASPYAFDAALSQLVVDLRLTRTLAQSRAAHYRLVVLSRSEYAIERLRPDRDGTWVPAGSDRRTRTLPIEVAFQGGDGATGVAEFDTRGTTVDLDTVTRFAMRELASGAVRYVALWPSGQVTKD